VESVRQLDPDHFTTAEFLVLDGSVGAAARAPCCGSWRIGNPSSGEVLGGGSGGHGLAPGQRNVHGVPELPPSYPHLSVAGQHRLRPAAQPPLSPAAKLLQDAMHRLKPAPAPVALRIPSPREEAISRADRHGANKLGLTPLLDRLPKGALRRARSKRVALGRAIARQPSCF